MAVLGNGQYQITLTEESEGADGDTPKDLGGIRINDVEPTGDGGSQTTQVPVVTTYRGWSALNNMFETWGSQGTQPGGIDPNTIVIIGKK